MSWLRWCVAASLGASRAAVHGADGLSFVAIGDWGGEDDKRPTTHAQIITGAAMVKHGRAIGADFALMMGDNFYSHGINVPDTESTRYETTFEKVYADLWPEQEFYAMAGNHDYGQNSLSNVSSQLGYAARSSQWRFPALWYPIHREFVVNGEKRSLDLLVIDTVVLCGNGFFNAKFIDQQLEFKGRPMDWTMVGNLRLSWADEQWRWLEASLMESSADYLWVSGHYPVRSAGADGSSQCLIERLLPLLEAAGAHYLNGHDHNLEHILHGNTHMFTAGAGKGCCYPPWNVDQIPTGQLKFMVAGHHGEESQPSAPKSILGGFAALIFGSESVAVTLRDHDGELLHEQHVPRRATAAVASIRRHPSLAPSDTQLSSGSSTALATLAAWPFAALGTLLLAAAAALVLFVTVGRRRTWRTSIDPEIELRRRSQCGEE